jgi:transposase
MGIVGGFDVHRQQITFDYVDTETGQLWRGQVRPATRTVLRDWLGERFAGRSDVEFAVEGCTGWRFVTEELARAGVRAHLAEPADTATLRGRKKRAKTGPMPGCCANRWTRAGCPSRGCPRRTSWRSARWAGCTAR